MAPGIACRNCEAISQTALIAGSQAIEVLDRTGVDLLHGCKRLTHRSSGQTKNSREGIRVVDDRHVDAVVADISQGDGTLVIQRLLQLHAPLLIARSLEVAEIRIDVGSREARYGC